MLCLRQKVCCNISWICSLICKNQDLTRSCDRINADITVHCFFGKGHKNISRSYDLIHLRNTLCSIGKCSDRLCAADLVDFISSCFFCSYQCGRIDLPVFSRRCCHDDLIYPRHLRRHNVHKNRRRINRLSTRNINADSLKWCHLLTKHGSLCFCGKPAVLSLFLVITSDVHQCFTDHLDQSRIYCLIGFFDLFFCNTNRFPGNFSLVKFLRIGKKGFIPFFFYVFENVIYCGFKLSIIVRTSFEKIFQNIFCTFFCQCYCTHCYHPFCQQYYLSITFLRSVISLWILSPSIFMLT